MVHKNGVLLADMVGEISFLRKVRNIEEAPIRQRLVKFFCSWKWGNCKPEKDEGYCDQNKGRQVGLSVGIKNGTRSRLASNSRIIASYIPYWIKREKYV